MNNILGVILLQQLGFWMTSGVYDLSMLLQTLSIGSFKWSCHPHYNTDLVFYHNRDVIMGAMALQITGSAESSGLLWNRMADERKYLIQHML